MDEELTLFELSRLETQRKLREIPAQVLETSWVRDAQVEAVIDAVLTVHFGNNVKAYAHARHVGEWCARIRDALLDGSDPTIARRVGVLADVDPLALCQIAELRHLALYVFDYQQAAISGTKRYHEMSSIVALADEFDTRLSAGEATSTILRSMLQTADLSTRLLVEALSRSARSRATQVA